MTPASILRESIDPALDFLRSHVAIPSDDRARVLVTAISGQEAGWQFRLQQGGGPARGLCQFEGLGGATGEVFQRCPNQLQALCTEYGIPFDRQIVFEALAWHDRLAFGMARLLLWPYPGALPAVGEVDAAWDYYLKVWRPGLPRRNLWDGNYQKAVKLITGGTT